MSDEFISYRNEAYFERMVEEREEVLGQLTRDLLSAVSRSPKFVSTLLQNPRGNSTSVATREAVLRRNIVRGLERLNAAAQDCAKHFLQFNLDRIELSMITEVREEAARQRELRGGGLKVYEGARNFLDELCFTHGVSNYKLAALNSAEIAQVAKTVDDLLAARVNDPRRMPSGTGHMVGGGPEGDALTG